jgi:TonB family protein
MRTVEAKAGKIHVVPLLIVLACFSYVLSQESPTPADRRCIQSGEAVYQPGRDGVKPPQPQNSKKDKSGPELRGPFSLELIVNSEGHVCDTRVLSANDRLAAEKAAKYISENWTFKPATKQGKPVAVKFTMNFGPR